MVCQNNNKLTKHLLTLSTKQTNNQPSHLRISRSHLDSHSHLNSRERGYYKSLIPTLTKLALPSLIIISTIISTCTPILSTTIPSVNAVTNNTNQTTTSTSTSNNTSSTTNLDPYDPNYLNTVLEANDMGANSVTNTTNEVDPTTMATDLASLNNALEAQAANEGISLSLSSNNQPVSTTNPATINIDPSTATGSGVTTNSILAATSITANVKTAMPGYSLSISTNTDNSNLTNTDSNLSSTQNGSNILPTAGTQDSPTSLTTNTWGYAMKRDDNNQYTTKFDTTYTTGNTNSLTSKWAKVPTSTETAQTIKHTEDTPQAAGDNTTVYYAANVPKNKTAGQYQATITYTATANVLDPPEVEKVSPETIGQGVQVVAANIAIDDDGSGNSNENMIMCYITDIGKIYCGSSSTGNLDGMSHYAGAIRNLTAYYRDSSFDTTVPEGAYNTVEAGTVGGGGFNDPFTAYWLEIDTSAFDGKVVQMAVLSERSANYSDGVACYLTDKGSVYCSSGARSYGTGYDAISGAEMIAPGYGGEGQFSTVQAGTASGGQPYYWLKVDTRLLEGNVVQVVAANIAIDDDGSGNSNENMIMCYITDIGKIYCGSSSTGNLDGMSHYAGAIRNLTAYYRDSSFDTTVPEGAYNTVEAGTVGGGGFNDPFTAYWLEIDTSAFDGKVVQMAVLSERSANYSDGVACYLTDKGSVYCSSGARSYGTGYDAISGAEMIAPGYGGEGQFSTVQAGTASGGQPYYWLKVDTRLLEGSMMNTSGTTITLTGNNLSKVTNVYIDANNNSALDEGTDMAVSNLKIISDTQLTFTAPSMSPGTYNLIITNPGNVVVKGTLTYR